MAHIKNARTIRRTKPRNFGLLAIGVSGPWEVSIDETTSGPERWSIQLEGPAVTFDFELPSLGIIGKIARFLQTDGDSGRRSNSLILGRDRTFPVTLIKDDEFSDRFFLLVGPTARPTVRFTLAGKDVEQIADALRQVLQDLVEED